MITKEEYKSNRESLKESYNRFYSKEPSYQGKTFEEVLNECMNSLALQKHLKTLHVKEQHKWGFLFRMNRIIFFDIQM